MSQEKQIKVCNWVAAGLMLVLLALQFVPFWQVGESSETVSISSYVWMPTENKALETSLQEALNDKQFTVNDIVGPTALTLALAAVGLVLCTWKASAPAAALLPIACGVTGLWGYLGKPALRLGLAWGWHVLVCALLLALGVYMVSIAMKKVVTKC